jgi:hypothetical protein
LQPRTAIRKHQGDGYGEGDRILRADDLPQTFERVLATTTRKGHRVLHADKEISLNNEVLGTHIASKASSPLVQEFGGRISVRL